MTQTLYRLVITFSELLLICAAAISQTSVPSMPNYGEIANAAIESVRKCPDLLSQLGKWPAAASEYGEFEMPPICWADAVKQLKPIKVYNHYLNVAIVTSIRDGVEEGIYISNPISSEVPYGEGVRTDGFEFINNLEVGRPINFRKHMPPRFEDYPADAVITGTLHSPNMVASSDERDIERIRAGVEKGRGVFHGSEEKKGINFAGQFILVQWNCGSSCVGMALVDAKSGAVFSPPDVSNCAPSFHLVNLANPGQVPLNPELQFRVDSNLLIIKSNGRAGRPYAFYYLWQGNRWTLLRQVPLVSSVLGQQKPTIIRLKVFHDGQENPTPNQITLSVDKQPLTIPVKNRAFEVPSQFLSASEVGVSADIDQNHISTAIPHESFVDIFSWEISIADKRYGKDVDYIVPKGANIPKSCIIAFIPLNRDGWAMFDPHCRSKRK